MEEPSTVERLRLTGWIYRVACIRRRRQREPMKTEQRLQVGKKTYKVVFVAHALMEERFLDAQCCGLQCVVDDPERDARRIANAGCTMASDTVGLSEKTATRSARSHVDRC